ncbi:hypothetical protein L3X38_002925 [Prunus dulcis]|uniref:RNase H type-1 domain-containing protein n=1 Tax=Prunus dulcis TaxID=3755 RepID=A0AAD4ZL67_PRUDU|nr:hypothetical protein L3X38_002925 [Prunus dulcis]
MGMLAPPLTQVTKSPFGEKCDPWSGGPIKEEGGAATPFFVFWICPGAQKVQEKVKFVELAEEYGGRLMRKESNIVVENTSKWSPPSVGKFKLNIDAPYIPSDGGIGAVIRNDKGEVMAAMTLPLDIATSPKHAEIKALSS